MDWQSVLPCRGWAETNRSRSCSFPKLLLIVLIMSDTIITAAAMRVIKLLVGHPPRKVLDLIDETGLTRTAVTEQLKNWRPGGSSCASVEHHSGRGRPRHRYMATQAALALLFANNQQLVVPTIWEAVNEVGGEDLVQTVLHAVSQRLAEHYRAKITASDPPDANQAVQGDSESRRRPHRPGGQAGPDYAIEADLRVHQHARQRTARLRHRPRRNVGHRRLSGATNGLPSRRRTVLPV